MTQEQTHKVHLINPQSLNESVVMWNIYIKSIESAKSSDEVRIVYGRRHFNVFECDGVSFYVWQTKTGNWKVHRQ